MCCCELRTDALLLPLPLLLLLLLLVVSPDHD